MASGDALKKAIVEAIRFAEKNFPGEKGFDAAEIAARRAEVFGPVPDPRTGGPAAARRAANPPGGDVTSATSDVLTGAQPTKPARIVGEPESGPGPNTLSESLGTKFDIEEEGVRPKKFLDLLEDEMDKLSKSSSASADELEAVAIENVEKVIDAGRPKRKFKTVRERRKVQEGRKAAIRRGEQKYIPKGNPEKIDKPPLAFGEAEFGTPGEITDLIDEAIGPRDLVNVGVKKRYGSIEEEGAKETLDNLFGAEESRLIQNIKDKLAAENIKRSRVPTERDRAEVLNKARDEVRLKEVDQMAKRVFDQIEDLERTLIMPKGTSEADITSSGIRGANQRLKNFKKEAAQAAARARESGDVSELTALEDRLTANLSKPRNEVSELMKTLILREAANRKTNQPRSTTQLKKRIKELGGTKEQLNALQKVMRDRLLNTGRKSQGIQPSNVEQVTINAIKGIN